MKLPYIEEACADSRVLNTSDQLIGMQVPDVKLCTTTNYNPVACYVGPGIQNPNLLKLILLC